MHLIQQDEDPCLHCGVCLSYCKWDQFERENPGQSGGPHHCRECMFCYRICARVHPSESFPDQQVFAPASRHPLLGSFQSAWSGWAKERASSAQDGGVTTLLLQMMLEQGMIDGAVVVQRDEEWVPVARLATSAEEISAGGGSKYTTSPAMVFLKEMMEQCRRLAVVCLPCQTTALRNLMHWSGGGVDPEGIVAILGVFCHESFRYQGIRALVEEQFSLPMSQVSRFDIKKNRLQFFQQGNAEPHGSVALADVKSLSWPVCHSCLDFTAELSDVSLGAVGSKGGENTILARTKRGQEIVEMAVRLGILELEPLRNMPLVERVGENKRKRAAELTAEESRYLLKQTLRGNDKKQRLAAKG